MLLLCHSHFTAAVHASAALALLAAAVHGTLTSLLLCCSCIAAAVLLSPCCAAVLFPHGSCCMWHSHITPVVALSITLLLLWCSHSTAAVPLLLGCCMQCMALSHCYCCASLTSLRLWRSPLRPLLLLCMVLSHCCCLVTLTWLAGAVACSYHCCRALSHPLGTSS